MSTKLDFGLIVFHFDDEGEASFRWICPKCGWTMYGYLADEPVSGWESPRWKISGPDDAPTLEPSLGCRGFRDGTCTGHYFFREGQLVDA